MLANEVVTAAGATPSASVWFHFVALQEGRRGMRKNLTLRDVVYIYFNEMIQLSSKLSERVQ